MNGKKSVRKWTKNRWHRLNASNKLEFAICSTLNFDFYAFTLTYKVFSLLEWKKNCSYVSKHFLKVKIPPMKENRRLGQRFTPCCQLISMICFFCAVSVVIAAVVADVAIASRLKLFACRCFFLVCGFFSSNVVVSMCAWWWWRCCFICVCTVHRIENALDLQAMLIQFHSRKSLT